MINPNPPIGSPFEEGKLKLHYEKGVKKLSRMQFVIEDKVDVVAREHLWVNGFSSRYLTNFKHIMPAGEYSAKKRGNSYYLHFSQLPFSSCTILIKFVGEDPQTHDVPLILRIQGLKQYLKEKLRPNYIENFQFYLLYHHGEKLDDDLTIEQCLLHISEKGSIPKQVDWHPIDPDQKAHQAGRQGYTGGTYESAKDFREFTTTLPEKLDIVCKISYVNKEGTTGGTGFLIAKNYLLTNSHIFKDLKTIFDVNVQFFCEDELGTIDIPPFTFDRVKCLHHSPPPPKVDPITEKNADITILKIKSPLEIAWERHQWWSYGSYVHYFKVLKLVKIASSCFVRFLGTLQSESRANIIQHPELGGKNVAFRENSIHARVNMIHYETGTREGSSGSPIVNDRGVFLGLHTQECFYIFQKLYANRAQLFKELKLKKNKEMKDPEKYTLEGAKEEILFYHKGPYKGMCTVNGHLFDLLGLIEKMKELPKPVKDGAPSPSPASIWAVDFLKIKREHLRCNAGIPAEVIFASLGEKNLATIQEAQKISHLDYIKPFRIPIFLVITVISLVSLAYFKPHRNFQIRVSNLLNRVKNINLYHPVPLFFASRLILSIFKRTNITGLLTNTPTPPPTSAVPPMRSSPALQPENQLPDLAGVPSTFLVDGQHFRPIKTEGAGACLLHAALGDLKNGKCIFGENDPTARTLFHDKLEVAFHQFDQGLLKIFSQLLLDAAMSEGEFARNLPAWKKSQQFYETHLEPIKRKIKEDQQQYTETSKQQINLLVALCKDLNEKRHPALPELEKIIAQSISSRIEWEKTCSTHRVELIPFFTKTQFLEQFTKIQFLEQIEKLKVISQRLNPFDLGIEGLKNGVKELAQSAEAQQAYLNVILCPDYWFTDTDASVIAHLYQISLRIFVKYQDAIGLGYQPFNPTANRTVAIFLERQEDHSGNHYWRCEPLT